MLIPGMIQNYLLSQAFLRRCQKKWLSRIFFRILVKIASWVKFNRKGKRKNRRKNMRKKKRKDLRWIRDWLTFKKWNRGKSNISLFIIQLGRISWLCLELWSKQELWILFKLQGSKKRVIYTFPWREIESSSELFPRKRLISPSTFFPITWMTWTLLNWISRLPLLLSCRSFLVCVSLWKSEIFLFSEGKILKVSVRSLLVVWSRCLNCVSSTNSWKIIKFWTLVCEISGTSEVTR